MTKEEAIDIFKCVAYHDRPNEEDIEQAIKTLKQESKTGHWLEKDVSSIKETTIERIQSCTCSNCGRIHTTPYVYYFDNFKYCPTCGAKMEA